jgi:UDP-N-acetylglucosamine 2-epimerase (non-hydrolysing)
VTVSAGTNTVVGTDPDRIVAVYRERRSSYVSDPPVPEKWDGQAAERIARVLVQAG